MENNNVSVVFDSHLLFTDPETKQVYSPTILNKVEPEIMNQKENGELIYVLQLSGALKERVWDMGLDFLANQQFISGKRTMTESMAFCVREQDCANKKYTPSLRVTETFSTCTPAKRINKELFSLINKREFDEAQPVMSYFEFERYHTAERFAHAFFIFGTAQMFKQMYYYFDEMDKVSDDDVCSMIAFLARFEEIFIDTPDSLYGLNASPLIDDIQRLLVNNPLSLSVDIEDVEPVRLAVGADTNVVPITRVSSKRRISGLREYLEDADVDELGIYADAEYTKYTARISSTHYDDVQRDFPTVCNEYTKLALLVERYVRKRYRTKRIEPFKPLAIAVVSGAWCF